MVLLQAHEAELAVEGLRDFDVIDIGSEEWMKQHVIIQKLNLQAHESIQNNSENYVLEALVTHDKLKVILHELIAIEAWRENVLTDQVKLYIGENCSIKGYHLLYHEAALCNLLEVVLYHDYVAQACGDTILDLLDYCCRRVAFLCSGEAASMKRPPEEKNFRFQCDDILWRSSIAAVSILRFLAEHVALLPLSVMNRMLDTHDVPCVVIPLIENPPWTRRSDKGVWEKIKDHKWEIVPPQDLLLITPLEAQAWLILFNLLCEVEVRKRYQLHSFRKDAILRIRKYLNTTLVDQLPVLADLQRMLDELVIVNAPPATSFPAFIMEQVAEIREHIMSSTDWNLVSQNFLSVHFKNPETRDDKFVRELAGMYGDSSVETLLSGEEVDRPEPDSIMLQESISSQVEEVHVEYPVSVTLYGQETIELSPIAKVGTPQSTSKGPFLRFQMRNQQENDEICSIPISLSSLTGMTMSVTDNLGQEAVITSNPLKSTEQVTFWQTFGSLSKGTLAQLQCTKTSDQTKVIFGALFLSLKKE